MKPVNTLITVILVSFALAFVNRPTTIITHRFDPPQADPDKQREISTTSSLKLDLDDMQDLSFWQTTNLSSVSYSSNGAYLRAITFYKEMFTNGAGDGMLSLNEAITAVRNYFVATGHLPQDGDVIRVTGAGSPGFSEIVIRRSNSNID